jgi:hypothetical protein
MKKFNLLGGALILCVLAMNSSLGKNGALMQYSAQYSGKLLGEVRVKEGLMKVGRCPELCAFISDSEMAIVASEL